MSEYRVEMDDEYAKLSLLAGMFAFAADHFLGRAYFMTMARAQAWTLTWAKLAAWKSEAIKMGVPAKELEPSADDIAAMPWLIEYGKRLQAEADRKIPVASSTNHCGSCSLCCKLLGISALDKMPNVWCKFCKPGSGCRVHNQPEFPKECANYVCLWLQSHHEGAPFADDLRPDRCHVVIDKRMDDNIHSVRCDIGYPHAWKDPKVQRLLQVMADGERSTVVLVTPSGEDQVLYSPHPTMKGVVQRHRR